MRYRVLLGSKALIDGQLLDTRYKVETPEGIDLILRPAGVV
ncbi:hypothetical protein ACQ4LH_21740, partial [Pseudomonas peli]